MEWDGLYNNMEGGAAGKAYLPVPRISCEWRARGMPCAENGKGTERTQ